MALTKPEKYHDVSGKVNRIPERIETFLRLNVARCPDSFFKWTTGMALRSCCWDHFCNDDGPVRNHIFSFTLPNLTQYFLRNETPRQQWRSRRENLVFCRGASELQSKIEWLWVLQSRCGDEVTISNQWQNPANKQNHPNFDRADSDKT